MEIFCSRSTDDGATWESPVILSCTDPASWAGDQFPQIATDGNGTWIVAWWSTGDSVIGTDVGTLISRSTDHGATWSTWHAPGPAPEGAGTHPQITTDGAGNWIIVGKRGDAVERYISAIRSSDNGATWSAPVTIETSRFQYEPGYPDVGMDASGNCVVVWEARVYEYNGYYDLFVSRSSDYGATWTAPEDFYVETDFKYDRYPRIATDGNGKWMVVWGSDWNPNSMEYLVMVKYSSDHGVTWGGKILDPFAHCVGLDEATWYVDPKPQIATNGMGRWAVVWATDWENPALGWGTDYDVLFTTSDDFGDTWELAMPLNINADADAGNDLYPAIAVRGYSNWAAAWVTTEPFSKAGGSKDIAFAFAEQNRPVTFPDPNLEAAVRDALSIPTGDIFVSDLAALTVLHASSASIQDLTGLEYCENLVELYLSRNSIASVAPLAGLTNLTRLYLNYNDVSDVAPLAGLTSLTVLQLDDNTISDVSPLAGLTNLTSLVLSQNSINDVSPLAGLTNLTWLQLYTNNISDVAPLAGLTSLTVLQLDDNTISDISSLGGLTDLWVLGLSYNNLSDVSTVANFPSLVWLFLGDNEISDLSPLTGLGYMWMLLLDNNNISDLGPLAGLTGLDDLGLAGNNITDVAPLAGLTGLEYLWLAGNDIIEVAPLAGLTGLRYVDLDHNAISEVAALVSNPDFHPPTLRLIADPLSQDALCFDIPALEARGSYVVHDGVCTLTGAVPHITLLGPNPVTVDLGGAYVDTGATAFDVEDGDLTAAIQTTSNLDTGTIGTYSVDYAVTDSDENTATAFRTVYVDSADPVSEEIDDTGGAVARPGVDVEVPAGATGGGTAMVSIDRTDVPSVELPEASDQAIAGTAYEINGVNELEGTTITIAYPDGNQDGKMDGTNIDESTLVVFAIHGDTGEVVVMEGDIDPLANTITITVPAGGIVFPGSGPTDPSSTLFVVGGKALVEFVDPNLESAVRTAIGKFAGAIYDTDVVGAGFTMLDAQGLGIQRLDGIEHCTDLITLWLHDNNINDLSPLSGLSALTWLQADNNQIADLRPLAALASLDKLGLGGNKINDLTPLTGLTLLDELNLASNMISDVGPLVANTGLASSDVVDLTGNPLSQAALCTDIPDLEARGVEVWHDGSCSGAGLAVSIMGPAIVTVPIGESHAFLASVSGAVGTVVYQWYYSDGSKVFVGIPDASEASYVLADVTTPNGGFYKCQVLDDVTAAESDPVELQVSESLPSVSAPGLVLLALAAAWKGWGRLRQRRR